MLDDIRDILDEYRRYLPLTNRNIGYQLLDRVLDPVRATVIRKARRKAL